MYYISTFRIIFSHFIYIHEERDREERNCMCIQYIQRNIPAVVTTENIVNIYFLCNFVLIEYLQQAHVIFLSKTG